MNTGLITCTALPVGANLFAWHRTTRHLRRDDKHQSLNPRGLTPRRLSYLPHGLIAHGQANKFAPTKAAWPSGKLIGRKTPLGRQNGFTLIELIMVIVILGILSAFALPRFFDATADARAARVNAGLGAARSPQRAGDSQCQGSAIGHWHGRSGAGIDLGGRTDSREIRLSGATLFPADRCRNGRGLRRSGG